MKNFHTLFRFSVFIGIEIFLITLIIATLMVFNLKIIGLALMLVAYAVSIMFYNNPDNKKFVDKILKYLLHFFVYEEEIEEEQVYYIKTNDNNLKNKNIQD